MKSKMETKLEKKMKTKTKTEKKMENKSEDQMENKLENEFESKTGTQKKKFDDTKGKVMLSYQWDSQKKVIKIKDELVKRGYEVWMDLEEMSGNIYEKMAEGVDGSAVIVVCMTCKYETSANCNREICYAQDKRKPIVPIKLEKDYKPNGALGLIVAGILYVDFSDKSKFDSSVTELEQEIDDKMNVKCNRCCIL